MAGSYFDVGIDTISFHSVNVICPVDGGSQLLLEFVADFVGSSNVIPADVAGVGPAGQWASLRPEDIVLDPAGRPATVTARAFHGRYTRLALDLDGQPLTALVPPHAEAPEPGTTARVSWDAARAHLLGAA